MDLIDLIDLKDLIDLIALIALIDLIDLREQFQRELMQPIYQADPGLTGHNPRAAAARAGKRLHGA